MASWRDAEKLAKRAIEDQGYFVLDANILFRANCPNIDLVVFGRSRATYVQVKSTTRPSGKDNLIVAGSPWTEEQLFRGAPIFNKKRGLIAEYILLVDLQHTSEPRFYIAPPQELEAEARRLGAAFANLPKKDGTTRSIAFRKELPRDFVAQWENAWSFFGSAEAEI